jgi:hypothetical protein
MSRAEEARTRHACLFFFFFFLLRLRSKKAPPRPLNLNIVASFKSTIDCSTALLAFERRG